MSVSSFEGSQTSLYPESENIYKKKPTPEWIHIYVVWVPSHKCNTPHLSIPFEKKISGNYLPLTKDI